LLIHLSYYGFEARNYIALILLSYVALGSFFDLIARHVIEKVTELVASEYLRNTLIRFGPVIGLIVLAAYPLPMVTKQVEQNWLISEQERYEPLPYNVDNRIVHETASWIQKHVLEDTSLVLFYAWEQQLKFELKDSYIVNTFRFDVQTEYVSGENFLDKIAANSDEKYIYTVREEDPTFLSLFYYPESRLYNIIRDTKAGYIVVGDRNASLQGIQDFFDMHPAFTQVFKSEENGFGTAVYRIQPELIFPCSSCPTIVQVDAMLELLDLINNKKLDEYQFLQRLGEHISIATRPGVIPNKRWAEAYAKLGNIYQENGQTESALLAYSRAGAIDAEMEARYRLIVQSDYSAIVKKYAVGGDKRPDISLVTLKESPELARDILHARGELDQAVFTYRYGINYQDPGQDSRVLYDFLDHFSADQNNPLQREDIFTINQQAKKILFQHPPSSYSDTVTIPEYPVELNCDIALSPDVWKSGMGDGVRFVITLSDSQGTTNNLFSKYIDPKNQAVHRIWNSCGKISLERWAGQTVTINFATLSNNNNRYDWAGWGEPRIVLPGYYNFLAQFSQADYEDHFGDIHRGWMAIQDDFRDVIYQQPTTQITYKNVSILENTSLNFGIGLDPRVWSPTKGDGVEFEIFIQDSPNHMVQVFDRYMDPKHNSADHLWMDFQVELSRFAGKTVDVHFLTHPGPVGNSDYDWAVWSNPILVSVP
jgi:tetratricopeptide (TPR) repeat protein